MTVPNSFNHYTLYLYYALLQVNTTAGWAESTLAAKGNYLYLTTIKTAKLNETVLWISTL